LDSISFSELILPPAGVLVASGEMSFFLVLLCSTLGSLAGALINYVIGLYFGRGLINKLVGKYGRFLFFT
jgi:membrane protein DedA with SNARE-associated domain